MQYYNNNKIQYILNFINSNSTLLQFIYSDTLKERLTISSHIKIVLNNIFSSSFIEKQLLNNNIKYYKINDITELKECNFDDCEYVLVLSNFDFAIVHNLDDSFINLFESKVKNNLGLLFAGQSINIPDINIEGPEVLRVEGLNKFLNSCIIFGSISDIKKYITLIDEVNYANLNFLVDTSKPIRFQLLNRFVLNYNISDIYFDKNMDYNNIDCSNDLFTTIIDGEQEIIELDNVRKISNKYSLNMKLL